MKTIAQCLEIANKRAADAAESYADRCDGCTGADPAFWWDSAFYWLDEVRELQRPLRERDDLFTAGGFLTEILLIDEEDKRKRQEAM